MIHDLSMVISRDRKTVSFFGTAKLCAFRPENIVRWRQTLSMAVSVTYSAHDQATIRWGVCFATAMYFRMVLSLCVMSMRTKLSSFPSEYSRKILANTGYLQSDFGTIRLSNIMRQPYLEKTTQQPSRCSWPDSGKLLVPNDVSTDTDRLCRRSAHCRSPQSSRRNAMSRH